LIDLDISIVGVHTRRAGAPPVALLSKRDGAGTHPESGTNKAALAAEKSGAPKIFVLRGT
jgi:hypothetical protein